MTAVQQSKKATVESLIKALEDNRTTITLSDGEILHILDQLKIHGRDTRDADAIYSDRGLRVFCTYAFGKDTIGVAQGALKIIANALLLQPSFRAKLGDLGHAESLVKIYHRQTDDDEFLTARILFLLTYGSGTDFEALFRTQSLAAAITNHLQRHATEYSEASNDLQPMGVMALSETLKLVFNLANTVPAEIPSLNPVMLPLSIILTYINIPTLPFESPVNTIINAMAILEFADRPHSPASQVVEQSQKIVPKLVVILSAAVDTYKSIELDTLAIPLFTVLRKTYEILPKSGQNIMQEALLPSDHERDRPLGQSATLASKLLRLMISPGLTHLPESIGAFLFEMSSKDASLFVKNIGYGYAAGYLMTHKIPIPESAKKAGEGAGSTEVPVNPVTGQRLDKEQVPDLVEMTQEEKEREAERLFVLFERLKATGVVDVKNPILQAMEEGRFEELDDSSSESN